MEKKRFVSLRVKIVIGVIAICLSISALAVLSIQMIAKTIIDKEYTDKAEQISEAVAKTLDPDEVLEIRDTILDVYDHTDNIVVSSEWGSDEWNEYMSLYDGIEELPLFQKLQDQLRLYQDIFKVNCIYLIYYKPGVKHAIYLVDGAYDDENCPPGVVDSFEDGIWPDENDIVIPASITNEDVYGWLVTGGHVVSRGDDHVAFLCVDISMNDIKVKERNYVILTAVSMLGLTIIMLLIALWYVGRHVIKPVIMLSDTAKNYCSENNDVIHHAFEKLQIESHDEIAQLLSSMKQMEQDMNSNIIALVETKVTLKETEDKAEMLSELARKDALTGIRNKTAYDYEVNKLENELAGGFSQFGLVMIDLNFLKRINDTYGHEKGNIAICRLSSLVCEVFEHSPVFRIGGDEFVVILKNRDYFSVDTLIDELNSRLEEYEADDTLNPWEKISAAAGYAKYDKNTDRSVEDVFKKADEAMYSKKESMKAQRKE